MEPTTPDIERIRDTFKEFLTSKGLRVTNQRLAIFDAAYGHEDHFTAEDLLDRARQIDSSVSRATVYRALPILTESSLIREVDVGRDYKFYMANKNTKTFQAQVICLDCDKIFEIDAPFMEWYGQSVASKLGLTVESQRLQVSARCAGNPDAACCKEKQD
ncbi:MAG: Fur family transcriptional regulator [Coraliomargarita sp.]